MSKINKNKVIWSLLLISALFLLVIFAIGAPNSSGVIELNLNRVDAEANATATISYNNNVSVKVISKNLKTGGQINVSFNGYPANEAAEISEFVSGLVGTGNNLLYIERITLNDSETIDRFASTIGADRQYYALDNHGQFFAYPGGSEFLLSDWDQKILLRNFSNPEVALEYLTGESMFPFHVDLAINQTKAEATLGFSLLQSMATRLINNVSYPITIRVAGQESYATLNLVVNATNLTIPPQQSNTLSSTLLSESREVAAAAAAEPKNVN